MVDDPDGNTILLSASALATGLTDMVTYHVGQGDAGPVAHRRVDVRSSRCGLALRRHRDDRHRVGCGLAPQRQRRRSARFAPRSQDDEGAANHRGSSPRPRSIETATSSEVSRRSRSAPKGNVLSRRIVRAKRALDERPRRQSQLQGIRSATLARRALKVVFYADVAPGPVNVTFWVSDARARARSESF